MKPRWLLEALGAALLLSLPYFATLLFPGDIVLYHHQGSIANLIWGLLLAMLEIALGILGVIAYFHYRFKPAPRAIVSAAITLLVVLRAVDSLISLTLAWRTGLAPDISEGVGAPWMLLAVSHVWFQWPFRLALTAGVAALAWWKPLLTQAFVKGTRLLLAAFAFCLLWVVPQLLFSAYGFKPAPRISRPVQAAKSERIIWVLFDELSYRLIFEQPPAGLQFPNFSRLRSKSVVFGDIQPSGFFTDRILPSLITGKQIDEIRSNAFRDLFYLNHSQHRWLAFDQNDSLFGIGRTAGWNTGVVGWYNPYCRILSSSLDSCYWVPSRAFALPMEAVGASSDKSVLANSGIMFQSFLTSRNPSREDLAAPRVEVYENLMQHARNLIRDNKIGFAFIHLLVPHPPGIYDRKTGKLCACGNYIDNLALADTALDQLEEQIGNTAQADQTTLIISSDHSWRVNLWKGNDNWTPEEERISQGKFDPRPVFMVHFPGQETAAEIDSQMPELIEHDVIAAILQHKIKNSDDLVSFVRASQKNSVAAGKTP